MTAWDSSFRALVLFGALFLIHGSGSAETPASAPSDSEGTLKVETEESGERAPFFVLDELTAELEFESALMRREIETDRGLSRDQKDKHQRFEEIVGIRGEGVLGGERFLLHRFMVRGGLSQNRFVEEGFTGDVSRRPSGGLFEYDFGLNLFPEGKISLVASGSRLDSRIPRPFLPSLDRTRERYDIGLFYRDRTLPMSLEFEHLDDDIRGGGRRLTDDEERKETSLRYRAAWNPDDDHSVEFEYEHERRDERYSGSGQNFETTRNYALLNHTLQFGDDGRSRWESLLRFQDESGDLATDNLEASSRLRLQHTSALSSFYAGQYLREKFAGLEQNIFRGDIGLSGVWRDRVTANIGLFGLHEDTDDNADSTEWGGTAGASYHTDNRFGRFSANLNYAHTRRRSSGGERRGVVVSESITLQDLRLPLLSHSHVVIGSVALTSADRSRIYLRGFDYVVIPLGPYTGISRMRTGNITDGETVLASYTFRRFDDFSQVRDRLDWRIEQEFEPALRAYYAGGVQNDNIDRDRFLTFQARNVNRHRIGIDYRKRRWSAGLEYEFHDDSIDPFQAFHLNGDVVFIERGEHRLSGRGYLSRFFFEGDRHAPRRNATLLDLDVAYRRVIGGNLEATASAAYRFETDSIIGDTHGADLRASIEYRRGLFTALMEIEYDMLNLPDSDDDTLAFWFKIRREIPIVRNRR
jgi:hypothetical protein